MAIKEFDNTKLSVYFTPATNRENIVSGENISKAFGKLSKLFTDLNDTAFTGDASTVNGHTVNSNVPSNAKFTDTTYTNFVKSGAGAKAGLVPAPSTTAGTTKYLREDGTWTVPPTNTGPKGDTGTAAGFGTPTATVDANVGTPSVTVTATGADTSKVFNFDFKNLKGVKGDTGSTGTRGSRWSEGTAITGNSTTAAVFTDSGITDALVNDCYLNTQTGYVYQCTTAGNASTAKWKYVGSIKGLKGDTGATGTTGTRGSIWTVGTKITGTSTTATVFSSSGITDALVNDMYLNTSTSAVYKCTTAGAASVAKWTYVGSIKGATGTAGTNATTTAVATTSANGLMSAADKTKLDGIATGANKYTHPTTAGNKHIPAGGSSGQILRWSADGTAVWGADNNTTYTAGTGLSLASNKFNHTNAVTAQTAYGHKWYEYDAQGHVTGSSYWIHKATGTDGQSGWVKIATFKHTKAYDNTPVTLVVSQRGNTFPYRITIGWKNGNSENSGSVDPDLGVFVIANDAMWTDTSVRGYIKKSATSTWDLYIKKLDRYECIAISDLNAGGYYNDHMTVTWTDVQVEDSTITGGTEATKKAYSTTDHTHSYLPLSGGTMTGPIKYNSGTRTSFLFTVDDDTSSGSMFAGPQTGGLTIIGGGESTTSLKDLVLSTDGLPVPTNTSTKFTKSTESLILSADTNIYFMTNCNTIADRKMAVINTDLSFIPTTTNTGSIGLSTNKWANMHATTFHGGLDGNSSTSTKWATARNINGMSVDGSANRVNYGTCSTAAATAAKTVACTGFALVTGAEITVKFTVTNTADSPTLNVNGTGAKPVYYRGSAISKGYLAANRTYNFRYNGTQYELVGDINTDTNTSVKQTALSVTPNSNTGLKLPLLFAHTTANSDNSLSADGDREINAKTVTTGVCMTGQAYIKTNYYTTSGDVGKGYTTICANDFEIVGNGGSFHGTATHAAQLVRSLTINGTEFDGLASKTINTTNAKLLYSGSGSTSVTLTESADNYDLFVVKLSSITGPFLVGKGYNTVPYGETPPPAPSSTVVIGSANIQISSTNCNITSSKFKITGNGSSVTGTSISDMGATITYVYGIKL